MENLEIKYLVYTTLLTGSIWIPVIVNRILEQGLWNALKQPQAEVPAKTPWGKRANRAHMNAVENLVVFAPLVLAIVALNQQSELTASLCFYFFLLRIAHYVSYMLAIPVVRTLLFASGWAIQIKLGLLLLG